MEQRELKFRLWNGEEMIQWDPNGAMVLSYTWSLEEIMAGRAPKDHVLMQYTGLKDRHGKEIYEGDFLKHEDHRPEVDKLGRETAIAPDGMTTTVVEWCGSNLPKYHGWVGWNVGIGLTEDAEVIGNIHENPDLLK